MVCVNGCQQCVLHRKNNTYEAVRNNYISEAKIWYLAGDKAYKALILSNTDVRTSNIIGYVIFFGTLYVQCLLPLHTLLVVIVSNCRIAELLGQIGIQFVPNST
jgi:hypothetical protein